MAVAQLTGSSLLNSLDPGHQLCVPLDEAVIPRLQTERYHIVVNKKSDEFENLCPKCPSKKVKKKKKILLHSASLSHAHHSPTYNQGIFLLA